LPLFQQFADLYPIGDAVAGTQRCQRLAGAGFPIADRNTNLA
jgi:hypothetical protein